MKMIKTAVVAGLLVVGSNAFADGAALYTAKLCNTCHGADGAAPIQPTYPKLNGQNSAYCQTQVKDIKSGKRNNGMAMVMKPLVAAVSDEEIAAICDFVASK